MQTCKRCAHLRCHGVFTPGSSSGNGFRDGLRWVFEQAPEMLDAGGDDLITFNFGRANTNSEPNKRYQIEPDRFLFSSGFPMQDHGNHGDESMLYGLDIREFLR